MCRKISKGTESLIIISSISFCTCKLMCLILLHDRLKIMSSNTPLPSNRYQNVTKCSGFRNLKDEIPIQTRDHSVHAVQELSIEFTTVKPFFLKGKSNTRLIQKVSTVSL